MRTHPEDLRDFLDEGSSRYGLVKVDRNGLESEKEDRLEKAQLDLRAAELMFNKELFGWTIVCSYYAMFHAVQAALVEQGVRALSHKVALDAFELLYTRRSEIPRDLSKEFRKARRLERVYVDSLIEVKRKRETAQYEIHFIVQPDADAVYVKAQEFVNEIEQMLAA